MTMRIQVGTLTSKVLSWEDTADRAWLIDYLSFDDPKARYTANKGARISLYVPKTDRFPSGLLPMVVKAAPDEGIKIELIDARLPPCREDPGADLEWLRDYQLETVNVACKRGRGILWLPTGCLAGDTKLVINRGGAARAYELRTVVRRLAGEATTNRAGKPCAWDLAIPTFTQSVDSEGFVRKNRIEHGWCNGVAEVFEVVTEGGRVLRATKDHRFLTPGGFARLHELRARDEAMVTLWPASVAPPRRQQYVQQGHMSAHPFAQISNTSRDGRLARVPLHRLVAEAHENSVSLAELVGRLVLGETDGLTFLDPEVWHVHHRDADARNNALSNLEVLSAKEHLAKHGREQGWKHVAGRASPERIRSITRIGEEETFDLQMADPMHNYVANEVVVHNSGKTEIIVALTRRLPCNWLALVHRSQLADDIAARYEKRSPGLAAGRILEGDADIPADATLVAATFQTLVNWLKRDPDDPLHRQAKDLLAWAQGLIIDETHVLPADTFYAVAMRTGNAFYRFGLSGTPLARGDRKSLLALAALGPVIHRVKTETLIERGILARPTVRLITVTQISKRPTWQGVYAECIVKGQARNAALVAIAKRATYPAFLFVQQVEHGKALAKALTNAGIPSEFVWGSHSLAYRKSLIRRMLAGHFEILVCSSVFQEGIDVPELRSVIVGSGGKSIIATLQRLGRGMRVDRKGDGTVRDGGDRFEVYDIADKGNKWLERHSRGRLNAYTAEGFETFIEAEGTASLFGPPLAAS